MHNLYIDNATQEHIMHPISKKAEDAINASVDSASIQRAVEVACSEYASEFLALLQQGVWSLTHAHVVLEDVAGVNNLDLMQISGLTRAMQIYQASF